MNKKRFNLRKVAAMVACLAVTTVFASCGKNGDDDGGDSNGKIDHRLIGSWSASINKFYVFHADGRFYHFSDVSATEGKFSTSNSKVYFSNIVYEKGEAWEKQYPDAVYEYEAGKDNDGDYLKIANFQYGITYVDISTAYKFRK